MDRVFGGFLHRQYDEGMALTAASDLLELRPMGAPPLVQQYVARFRCTGLIRTASGAVQEANDFAVGISFPDDYLRRADPATVLAWLYPREIFHPNISTTTPFICVGRMGPGTSLVDLLYQLHEMITYQKATVREDDALNWHACAWSRANAHRLPVDTRPLKRRRIELTVVPVGGAR